MAGSSQVDPDQTGVGVPTLEALAADACRCASVRKNDLHWGDRVLVTTKNSVYTIWNRGDGTYFVSGGWFDRQRASPAAMTINGCTWGGSAIKHDIVAAPGLFLEFGNRVKTTRIQTVRVIRNPEPPLSN